MLMNFPIQIDTVRLYIFRGHRSEFPDYDVLYP